MPEGPPVGLTQQPGTSCSGIAMNSGWSSSEAPHRMEGKTYTWDCGQNTLESNLSQAWMRLKLLWLKIWTRTSWFVQVPWWVGGWGGVSNNWRGRFGKGEEEVLRTPGAYSRGSSKCQHKKHSSILSPCGLPPGHLSWGCIGDAQPLSLGMLVPKTPP